MISKDIASKYIQICHLEKPSVYLQHFQNAGISLELVLLLHYRKVLQAPESIALGIVKTHEIRQSAGKLLTIHSWIKQNLQRLDGSGVKFIDVSFALK